MVETYLRNRAQLRLVLLLLDIRRDPGPEEQSLVDWLEDLGINYIPVLTKVDKVSRGEALSRRQVIARHLAIDVAKREPLLFSARTGEGKKKLGDIIPIFLQK